MKLQINPETGTKYSRAELKAAYELVQNELNWKNPIKKSVVLTQAMIEMVTEAVIFFAGCRPTFKLVSASKSLYLVEAVGYYVAVGA